ncbi:MAG TPA: hypothetical protein VFO40_06930 [Chthoniobacterales bacterium]|nr:hypothetical protein [Chthoniobacterales bacterium]
MGRHITADRAPVYERLIALGIDAKIITDGTSCVLEDLILTTVPDHCSNEQKSIWLDRGQTIRRQRGSQWLVLHHVPPNPRRETVCPAGFPGCEASVEQNAGFLSKQVSRWLKDMTSTNSSSKRA